MSLIPPCQPVLYTERENQQPEVLKEMTFTYYSHVSIFKDTFFTMDPL